MTPRRKARKESEVLKILARQITERGGSILCDCGCGEMLDFADAERHHWWEVALDGPDDGSLEGYVRAECHKRLTNGNGATSAGSSKHKVAKGKRIRKKAAIARGEIPAPRKAKIANRPFSKQSRPFPKRAKPCPSGTQNANEQ
jgi:hypothetical protein